MMHRTEGEKRERERITPDSAGLMSTVPSEFLSRFSSHLKDTVRIHLSSLTLHHYRLSTSLLSLLFHPLMHPQGQLLLVHLQRLIRVYACVCLHASARVCVECKRMHTVAVLSLLNVVCSVLLPLFDCSDVVILQIHFTLLAYRSYQFS